MIKSFIASIYWSNSYIFFWFLRSFSLLPATLSRVYLTKGCFDSPPTNFDIDCLFCIASWPFFSRVFFCSPLKSKGHIDDVMIVRTVVKLARGFEQRNLLVFYHNRYGIELPVLDVDVLVRGSAASHFA